MLIGRDITVIGAGIGGLATALALALRGARVEVLEQAPEITEIGAGIQISPNGMVVLDALGVAGDLIARSVTGQGVRLIDGLSGRDVLRMDLSALGPEHPWLFVHRADLVDVLANAARAAGVRLRLNAKVEVIAPVGAEIRLTMPAGETLHRSCVIAADGGRSLARDVVDGTQEPAFTGQTAWRALVPVTAPAVPEVRVFLGPGRHLVAYPLRDGRTMNLVAVQERPDWVAESWIQTSAPDVLQAAFADFAPEVRELLQRVTQVHLWGLFKRPVARRWYRGPLALLGDAAHPTLPFLAQGACMALEDAWMLAASLSDAGTPEEGFGLYQARRQDRCARIVAAADGNARAYHLRAPMRGPALAALRLGGRVAPGAALKRFAWLHGHDVTRA
ncbi:MAG: FAD-dependent monooxygenase [Rhodobacteraceae bacterium]|nr:FAD-dependent monooxygenase [Paracoccaceae bacterium]